MIPFAESCVTAEEMALFRKIEKAVSNLSEVDLGRDEEGKEIILSCHILARAVARVFGLKYVDGFFYPNFEHTWLLTESGNVIDVYPVAMIGGPIMVVDPQSQSPAYWLYKRKRLPNKGFKRGSFRKAVNKIATALETLSVE